MHYYDISSYLLLVHKTQCKVALQIPKIDKYYEIMAPFVDNFCGGK